MILGPGSNIFNVGLSKYFTVTERVRIRWELSTTNAFNHPNWANPQTSITSLGQVGVITATGGVSNLEQSSARNLRMGVRVEW